MGYWIFKSEPDECSFGDILAAPKQTLRWEGIRNYQARNFIRDQIALNDKVFIYHSRCKPTAIVGLVKVVKKAYPDPSQFDPTSLYFDPKAKYDSPRWFSVDIQVIEQFPVELTLAQIKSSAELVDLALLKQARLSVTPVLEREASFLLSRCKSLSQTIKVI